MGKKRKKRGQAKAWQRKERKSGWTGGWPGTGPAVEGLQPLGDLKGDTLSKCPFPCHDVINLVDVFWVVAVSGGCGYAERCSLANSRAEF